jgi:YVTN family beta-propeller protein
MNFMAVNTIDLDLRGLKPDQQVARLREQYVLLRGKGSVVRAQVDDQPVRQYISMLERGYRVMLEANGETTWLVLRPDASTPRLGLRGAHSLVRHDEGRIYTNTIENRLAVIDESTRQVLRHIPVGDDPSHLELSHNGRYLYVANSGSDDVTIVDTASDQVIATAATGRRPLLPCVAPDGKFVYLPSGPDRTVTVLRAGGEFVKTIPVGAAPHDIVVSPDNRWAYQPNSASHTVSVIDKRDQAVVGEFSRTARSI